MLTYNVNVFLVQYNRVLFGQNYVSGVDEFTCTNQISDSFFQLSDFLLQVKVPLCQSLHHLL